MHGKTAFVVKNRVHGVEKDAATAETKMVNLRLELVPRILRA
ncbi:hypothetical protein [Desulfosporosinus hippei]|nr:hypothetical protein [Desulfosporosinus hippei]